MHKQVLVNIEENVARVAFLEDSNLVELFIEEYKDLSLVGNIYHGVIEDIVPGIKAAFVDIGLERRAFLHFDDFSIDALFLKPEEKNEIIEKSKGKDTHQKRYHNNRPDALSIMKKGMPIMVQVTKDEIGQKSPRVTSYVTLPGRYLVLLPFKNMEGGISKKIDNKDERQRLKRILNSLKSQKLKFIIRTAGYEQDETNLIRDKKFLNNEWNRITRTFRRLKSPSLIYNDHDIYYRIIRDIFTNDITEIIIDDSNALNRIKNILKIMIPELKDVPKYFDSQKSLFDAYDIERQIQKAVKNKLWLKSGGFIVIDEMEALTAIDINTGRFVGTSDQEKTIFKTNLEAAKLIAQQIRLRDIGGLIIIDFIDMLKAENKALVEEELRKWLKFDKAKMAISKIGDFGLLEMTRKRVKESLIKILTCKCPYCEGSGRILNYNEIWRKIKYAVINKSIDESDASLIVVHLHSIIKKFIESNFGNTLSNIEKKLKIKIDLTGSDEIHIEDFDVKVFERKKYPKNIKLTPKKTNNTN